ncbi:hypothetical protein HYW76_04995 [Candidatus Pacearchaeota archaeon]|nr:hypothetical protein [Candidatus Pacearchaeota archaeon]
MAKNNLGSVYAYCKTCGKNERFFLVGESYRCFQCKRITTYEQLLKNAGDKKEEEGDGGRRGKERLLERLAQALRIKK